jgi:hypothetical protein
MNTSSCLLSTTKFKTEWWQRYQDHRGLDGEGRTVKVTLSVVSPRVGHSLGQNYHSGGTKKLTLFQELLLLSLL